MARGLVIAGGLLILLSSIPHALLGWPAGAEVLRGAGVAADDIAGFAVGWLFGSAAMIGLGAAALVSAPQVSAGNPAWRVPFAIGLAYASFGVAAFAYRSFAPHFLLFVVSGGLLLVGSLLGRRSA